MRTRSALLAIDLMALGGLLGSAAASGPFPSLWQAREARNPASPTAWQRLGQQVARRASRRVCCWPRSAGLAVSSHSGVPVLWAMGSRPG
jgi:hypothetical protein